MDVEKPPEELFRKYKYYAIAIISILTFLYNKKLFFSLLFLTLGLILFFTFSTNIHRKSEEVVKTGIIIGILLILLALIILVI